MLMGSDGSRQDLIKMEAGGYRNQSSLETLTEKVVDDFVANGMERAEATKLFNSTKDYLQKTNNTNTNKAYEYLK